MARATVEESNSFTAMLAPADPFGERAPICHCVFTRKAYGVDNRCEQATTDRAALDQCVGIGSRAVYEHKRRQTIATDWPMSAGNTTGPSGPMQQAFVILEGSSGGEAAEVALKLRSAL